MEEIKTFITSFLFPTFISLGEMLIKIFLIITVVMFFIEILKALKVLHWLNKKLYFFTRFLGISAPASFPLLIGILIGITYGAGAILISYKNGEMSKKDVILVSVFLCLCHAVFEDILLFVTLGANGIIVFVVKLFLATLVTYTINRIIMRKERLVKN